MHPAEGVVHDGLLALLEDLLQVVLPVHVVVLADLLSLLGVVQDGLPVLHEDLLEVIDVVVLVHEDPERLARARSKEAAAETLVERASAEIHETKK